MPVSLERLFYFCPGVIEDLRVAQRTMCVCSMTDSADKQATHLLDISVIFGGTVSCFDTDGWSASRSA